MFVSNEAVGRVGVDADTALAAGIVGRVKVQNRWLYFTLDEPDTEVLLDRLAEALDVVLGEWLLNPAQYLVGQVLEAVEACDVSRAACTLLIHELCGRQRLDGLALMARSLQPYLAFFRPCDRVEIERQVDAMRSLLERNGTVTWRELPEPERNVPRKVWRMTIVAHGVWLGLGYESEQGVLEAW